MEKRFSSSDNEQSTRQPKETSPSRRDAMKAIARFSAYVAPATFVLLDSKSAFAKKCSGNTNGNGGGNGNGNGNGGTGNGNGNGNQC